MPGNDECQVAGTTSAREAGCR